MLSPDYAALHPGYDCEKKKGKRNADKRCVQPPHPSDAARTVGCARLSAFHRGSCVRDERRRLSSRPGFLGLGRTFDPVRPLQPGSEDLALLHGRYPRPPVPSRERTSQTGHSAGRMMPKAAPARIAKPRGSTALAPCSGVPREHDPLSEQFDVPCIRFGDECQRLGTINATPIAPSPLQLKIAHRTDCTLNRHALNQRAQ